MGASAFRRSVVLGAVVVAIAIGVSAARGQQVTRESVDSSGVQANYYSENVAISGDGRLVAFKSPASNLVPNDTIADDVFVHDRLTGVTTRVSVDSNGNQANGISQVPALSADGRFVAFGSTARNLDPADDDFGADVYVHDLGTGATTCVSLFDSDGTSGGGNWPSLSADGALAAFNSWGNLVAADTNGSTDIYVRDLVNGTNELISVDSAGALADDFSFYPVICADGRCVAFCSYATNLVANDTNQTVDVFVRDRVAGTTERVSVDSNGVEGDQDSGGFQAVAISADSNFVMFVSNATNLVAGDTNVRADVFVRDRAAGVTERVSVDSSGVQANGSSYSCSISSDGQLVVFSSLSTNLVAADNNGASDIFLRDRAAGTTTILSRDRHGTEANNPSYNARISADARHVVFESDATNLVSGDTNGYRDVFVAVLYADATWSNYGSGHPGTLGVPNLTASADPVQGSTISLALDNSLGASTPALLLFGWSQLDLPTSADGTLLVDPVVFIPEVIAGTGAVETGTVPTDLALYGASLYLQAIEFDPGASQCISFTPGLELFLGE